MSSGGRREGAGRKPIDPKEKKVQVSVSVTPKTKEMIKQLRETGLDVNKLFEEYILEIKKN